MRTLTLFLASIAAAHGLAAQQRPTRSLAVLPTWQATTVASQDSLERLVTQPVIGAPVAGAVGGGLAGAFIFGWIGYELGGGGEICGDDPCGLAGSLYGVVIGEALGVAAGAHWANGHRGSFGIDLATSLTSLLVTGLLAPSGVSGDVMVPLALITQLAATVAAERLTARHTDRSIPH